MLVIPSLTFGGKAWVGLESWIGMSSHRFNLWEAEDLLEYLSVGVPAWLVDPPVRDTCQAPPSRYILKHGLRACFVRSDVLDDQEAAIEAAGRLTAQARLED